MNKIGILQGRLLPKSQERLQVFPSETWEKEFEAAKECGFSAIELLFDIEGYDKNPLIHKGGQKKIVGLTETTGLAISSIGADFFRRYGFFRNSQQVKEGSISILRKLIESCRVIQCQTILIPFFEETEIKNRDGKQEIIRALSVFYRMLEEYGINLCLETTLPASELAMLMEEIAHPNIKIYYDLGNSVPLKHNAAEDIRQLSKWIGGIHVKDRNVSGENVILGRGLVDFKGCFQALKEIKYEGSYILETSMGDNPIETAKYHLGFVKELLDLS